MDQLDIAVHQTAHAFQGGLDRLAQMMGMGAQTLRNKVNPNSDTHRLALREALAMMLQAQDYQILEVLAAECGFTIRSVAGKDQPLLTALLMVQAEHGDVTRSMATALQAGSMTQRKIADIRREISEARAALDVLEQVISHG